MQCFFCWEYLFYINKAACKLSVIIFASSKTRHYQFVQHPHQLSLRCFGMDQRLFLNSIGRGLKEPAHNKGENQVFETRYCDLHSPQRGCAPQLALRGKLLSLEKCTLTQLCRKMSGNLYKSKEFQKSQKKKERCFLKKMPRSCIKGSHFFERAY